jgi:hypothetical protein
MIVYQIKILDASFFFKSFKNIFYGQIYGSFGGENEEIVG